MRLGTLFVALFALALIVAPYAAAGEKACDVKTVKTVKWCGHCDKEIDKPECCGEKAQMVEVCVKKQYSCKKCDVVKNSKDDCCDPENMVKVENKAKTVWACPGCKTVAEKGAHCEECDKDVVKTCEKSGEEPHVAAAKEGEGEEKGKSEDKGKAEAGKAKKKAS